MQNKQVIKLDRGSVGKDGVFRATVQVARIGTQEYPQGINYRSPVEVRKSVTTADRIGITIDHRDEELTPDNASNAIVGFTSNPKYNPVTGWIELDIAVSNKEAITLLTSTHQYFSVGYGSDDKVKAGIYTDVLGLQGTKGKTYPYDIVQHNMTFNHVTITSNPRAGKGATIIKMDSINEADNVLSIFQIADLNAKAMIDKKRDRNQAMYKRSKSNQVGTGRYARDSGSTGGGKRKDLTI